MATLTALSVYQSIEVPRTNLLQSHIDDLQPTYQNKRVTLASIGANTSIIKLPAGHFGQAVISRNGSHPLVVTLFGKVAMLDPSSGKPPVYITNVDDLKGPHELGRQIGLELFESEDIVADALHVLCSKFSDGIGSVCNVATESAIPFTASSSKSNLRIVFLHHNLVTPEQYWDNVTGGEQKPGEKEYPPMPMWETGLDAQAYRALYAEARNGLYRGKKCLKAYPTPLPVVIDGHEGRTFSHTILKKGDCCGIMCMVVGRTWKSKKTGGMMGKVDFVPLKIRVHGNFNLFTTGSFASTSTEAPETKLATPVKRSALNVELDVDDTDSEDSELLSSSPLKRQKP